MKNRKVLSAKFSGLLLILTLIGLKSGFALSFLDEPKSSRASIGETTFRQECSELFLDFITEYYSILASGNDEFRPSKSFDDKDYVFKDTGSRQSTNVTERKNDRDSQLLEIVSQLLSFNPTLANIVLQYIGQRKNVSTSALEAQNSTYMNFDTFVHGDAAEILNNLTTGGETLRNMNPFILTSTNFAARTFDQILRKKREVHLILDYMLDVLEDIVMGLRRSADSRLNKELVRLLRQSQDSVPERTKRQLNDHFNVTMDEEHGSWGSDLAPERFRQVITDKKVTDNIRGTLGETIGLFLQIFNALTDRGRFEMDPNPNTYYIESLIDRLFPKLVILDSQTSNPNWELNPKPMNLWDKSESQIHNHVIKIVNDTSSHSFDANENSVLDDLAVEFMNGTRILKRIKRTESSSQATESSLLIASSFSNATSLNLTTPTEQSKLENFINESNINSTGSIKHVSVISKESSTVNNLIKSDVRELPNGGNSTMNDTVKEVRSKRQTVTGYKPVVFVSTVDSAILSKENDIQDTSSNSKIDNNHSTNRPPPETSHKHVLTGNSTLTNLVSPNINNFTTPANFSETRPNNFSNLLDTLTLVYLNRSSSQPLNPSAPLDETTKTGTLAPPKNPSNQLNSTGSDSVKPLPASEIVTNNSTKPFVSIFKTNNESRLLVSSIPQSFLNDSTKPANNILAVVGDSIKSIISSAGESAQPASTLSTMNGSQPVTSSSVSAVSNPMDILISSVSQALKESSSAYSSPLSVESNHSQPGNGTLVPAAAVVLNSNIAIATPNLVNQSAQVSAFLEKLRTEIIKAESNASLPSRNETASPMNNSPSTSAVLVIKNETKFAENVAPVISGLSPPNANLSLIISAAIERQLLPKISNETVSLPKEIPANEGKATELLTVKSILYEASDKLASKNGLLTREPVKSAREMHPGSIREYAGFVAVLVLIGLLVVISVFVWKFSSENQGFDSENLTIREPICPSPPRAGGMNNFNYSTTNSNIHENTSSARTCGRTDRELDDEIRIDNLRGSQMIELTQLRKPDIPA